MLEQELKTYNENKKRLLEEASGKYVLIKDAKIIGVYESEIDAIKLGIQKFGNVPFLVKKIAEIEQTHNYMSGLVQIGR
jgi:hypothetical protein